MPAERSTVDQLGEDIALLASQSHPATYDLLVLLRRFDAACGWNNGFRSCAHWLHSGAPDARFPARWGGIGAPASTWV